MRVLNESCGVYKLILLHLWIKSRFWILAQSLLKQILLSFRANPTPESTQFSFRIRIGADPAMHLQLCVWIESCSTFYQRFIVIFMPDQNQILLNIWSESYCRLKATLLRICSKSKIATPSLNFKETFLWIWFKPYVIFKDNSTQNRK